MKMYSQYISHVLEKCFATLSTGQVKVHFLLCNCMEMTPCIPAGWKYDRVSTSNMADYEPLTSILDMCKPLLNAANPSAVIVTEFQNWSDHISQLFKKELLHSLQMPTETSHQQVLQDTQNPAIDLYRIPLQCVRTIAPERGWGGHFHTFTVFLSTPTSTRCYCLLECGKGL